MSSNTKGCGTFRGLGAECAARLGHRTIFNAWDRRRHHAPARSATGVWEVFLPLIGEGHAL